MAVVFSVTARRLGIFVGRNAERGEETVAEIRTAGGKADFISSDLRDALSVREVARRAIELGNGYVDILINNAGTFPFGPTHEMTGALFDNAYSLNVKAPYFLVAELAPLMVKGGKGAIVNVSTMAADYGAVGMSLYSSSRSCHPAKLSKKRSRILLNAHARSPQIFRKSNRGIANDGNGFKEIKCFRSGPEPAVDGIRNYRKR